MHDTGISSIVNIIPVSRPAASYYPPIFMKILQDSTTSIINYVPTTICITHYISQTNYLAKACACMKMIRERTYSHVIRGSLSCPGSVSDIIGNLCSFPLKCVD